MSGVEFGVCETWYFCLELHLVMARNKKGIEPDSGVDSSSFEHEVKYHVWNVWILLSNRRFFFWAFF